MVDFFQFVLDCNLQLKDAILVLRVFDLLSNFLSFGIKTSLIERLSVIELV